MPTLITEDTFESGGTWDGSAGTPVIVSSPVPQSSTRALQLNAIGEYVYWNIPDSGYVRCVLGAWIRFPSFPATNDTHVFKLDFGPTEGWMVVNTSGQPYIRADGTPTMGSQYHSADLVADNWYWTQLMADVSANPWELKLNIGGTVTTTTGAAAASNLNPGIFLLGNTTGGDAITVYHGHAKMGVASDDNDWFAEPPPPTAGGATAGRMLLLGVG